MMTNNQINHSRYSCLPSSYANERIDCPPRTRQKEKKQQAVNEDVRKVKQSKSVSIFDRATGHITHTYCQDGCRLDSFHFSITQCWHF